MYKSLFVAEPPKISFLLARQRRVIAVTAFDVFQTTRPLPARKISCHRLDIANSVEREKVKQEKLCAGVMKEAACWDIESVDHHYLGGDDL